MLITDENEKGERKDGTWTKAVRLSSEFINVEPIYDIKEGVIHVSIAAPLPKIKRKEPQTSTIPEFSQNKK